MSGSLLGDLGGSFTLTLANYRAVFHQSGQVGPLERSMAYAAITASIAVAGGFIAAWLLAQRRARSSRLLDFLLLSAIALPSVVFAAGYIFAYNLPVWSSIGISLYQTALLLIIAYTAASLPTSARVLSGTVSQLPPSLRDAARTHGAGSLAAWARGVLPVVSRPLVMAWLLAFAGCSWSCPSRSCCTSRARRRPRWRSRTTWATTTSASAWPSRSSRWRWRWPWWAWPSAATGWPPRPAGGGSETASRG